MTTPDPKEEARRRAREGMRRTRARRREAREAQRAAAEAAAAEPKVPKTSTERVRQYRQRQREQRTPDEPVRRFLTGIVTDFDRDTADPEVVVEAWQHARAMEAIDLLSKLDVAGDKGSANLSLIYFVTEAATPAEQAEVREEHERSFQEWLREGGKARAAQAATPIVAQAMRTIAWADNERIGKRANTAILGQGLKAVRRVIAERTSPAVEEAYSRFTLASGAYAFQNYAAALGSPEEKDLPPSAATMDDE